MAAWDYLPDHGWDDHPPDEPTGGTARDMLDCFEDDDSEVYVITEKGKAKLGRQRLLERAEKRLADAQALICRRNAELTANEVRRAENELRCALRMVSEYRRELRNV